MRAGDYRQTRSRLQIKLSALVIRWPEQQHVSRKDAKNAKKTKPFAIIWKAQWYSPDRSVLSVFQSRSLSDTGA